MINNFFKRKLNTKIIEVFEVEECNEIIKDFIKNERHIKLSSDHGVERISSYEIDYKFFSKHIQKLIDSKINKIIKPFTKGGKGMVFGVRYSLDTKAYMDNHYDCNTYSCVITLNENFVGGGTFFPFSGEIIQPKTGQGLLFRADTLNSYHSAYPIRKGIRYVLVVRMEKYNSIFVLFKAIFLHFIDKYIRKNHNKFGVKP